MTRALWELLTFGGLGLRWWERIGLVLLAASTGVGLVIGFTR